MDIKKLTGNENPLDSTRTQRSKVNPYQEQQARDAASGNSAGLDTVNLSNLSRQLSKISGILEKDEISRENKVAALKQQVESGTYKPESKEVARSLISYIADGEVRV
jgi:negative regulator of flagellin synthesis FlgM